jgi:chorismate-pyruvate lyase
MENLNFIIKEIKEGKIEADAVLQNKLWKLFISNDGLMTISMKNLFEDKLTMKLLKSSIVEQNELVKELEDIVGNMFKSKNIVERLVEFSADGINIMYGLSFWNDGIYDSIMQKDIDKPIGLIMKEQEIEYYRNIKYYITKDNQPIRISAYKIQRQLALILVEMFETKPMECFFGLLK